MPFEKGNKYGGARSTDGKVAQGLIGDSEEEGVRLVHTITRKIVEPGAK